MDYRLDENPKYTIKECKERDATYAAPLYVTARLLNKETGEVKEQEIFMGDFPLMTDSGTFISNGAERVNRLPAGSLLPACYYGSSYDTYRQGPVHRHHEPQPGRLAGVRDRLPAMFSMSASTRTASCLSRCLIRALGLSTDEQIQRVLRRCRAEDQRHPREGHHHTTPRKACWRSTASCAPASPRRSKAPSAHLDALFFDPRRYDLSRFGRYKMNKKLALARRIAGLHGRPRTSSPP